MQSSRVTSGPRQHVLTRSRSLSFPLTEIDHVAAVDAYSTDCSAGREKGLVTSMLITENGNFGDEDGPQTLEGLGKPLKKSMRRQKSLAELFGVALYKSKVHLHELVSRRGKPGQPRQEKTGEKSVLSFHPPLETMASEETERRVQDPDTERDDRTGVSASSVFLADSGNVRHQKLIPREPVVMGNANRHTPSTDNSMKQHRRVPEELFCVTREVNRSEQSALAPDLKALPPHGPHGLQCGSTHKADRKMLTSAKGSKARPALVKSNSDSVWRLRSSKPASGACVGKGSPHAALPLAHKASSSFVSRSASSKHLPRDSKVGIITTNTVSPPLSNMVAPDCVSSIVDWLWLGSVEAAYNEPLLCNLKVDAVVDISNVDAHCVPAEKKTTCPCTCNKAHFCTKLNVAVDDIEWENIDQYFADANAFIGGWRQRGSRVLVVSYHGKSRGPAFVVQHLMHHYRIPLERALTHVRSRRPQTRINPGFLRVLQRLDKRLDDQRDVSDLSAPDFPDQVPTRPKTAWDEC